MGQSTPDPPPSTLRPVQPKRRRPIRRFSLRRFLVRLAVFLLVLIGGLSYWGWQSWQNAIQPVGGSQPIRVVIASGTGIQAMGRQLQEAGVIRSALAWRLWNRWGSGTWILQAGTYDLDPSQTLVEIVEQIRQGNVVSISVTIPEGWRIRQMAKALEDQHFFGAEDFLAAAQQTQRPEFSWLPSSLPSPLPSLEGYLFPDTYRIPLEQMTPETVIKTMLQQFERTALPLYKANQQAPQPSSLSLHEWVTLASIVEKEAVVAQERPLIAAVFLNRLELNIPLGADPTVEYAFNIRQTENRRLTLREVRTPSPYNTYLNPGLPPTAIASPGLAALQATLDPAQTEYLYFVALYDGTHVFSKTLTEHETAQRQIIRTQQRQDRARQPLREPVR